MNTFVWSERFETGIDEVDQQHRKLVDLINQLANLGSDRQNENGATAAILSDLVDYAYYHFAEEESLMEDRGLDRRHIEHHQRQHSQFIETVGKIWDTRDTLEKPVEVLEAYLSSWLTTHILDEDQSMARQMGLIDKGMLADVAYQRDKAI